MSLSLLSIANFVKGAFTLFLTKAIAVSFGPSGIVALGGLQNILGIIGPISNLGANSGSVLFFSKASKVNLKSIIYTLAILFFVGFLFGLSALFIVWKNFSVSSALDFEISLLSLSFFCLSSSIVALIAGYLQGRGMFVDYALAIIFGSVLNFIILVWALYHFSLSEMVNLAALQLSVYALSMCFIARKEIRAWFDKSVLFQHQIVRPLLKIGTFSLIAGVALSAGFINIRGILINDVGLEITGNWDAAMRIFPIITLVVCMPIFSRYFSELCKAKGALEVIAIYKPIIKVTSIIFGLGLITVYFQPYWVVYILFSDSFVLYIETIFLFVIGDVIRSFSTILNYINLASENYLRHFLGEIIFVVALVIIVNTIQVVSFKTLAIVYIAVSLLSLFFVIFFISLQWINKKFFFEF